MSIEDNMKNRRKISPLERFINDSLNRTKNYDLSMGDPSNYKNNDDPS
jgi:hypothetical protein